jgi:hypothetical protein
MGGREGGRGLDLREKGGERGGREGGRGCEGDEL